ncbi:hypothetical protein [Streptosporangium sp. NPDC004631]
MVKTETTTTPVDGTGWKTGAKPPKNAVPVDERREWRPGDHRPARLRIDRTFGQLGKPTEQIGSGPTAAVMTRTRRSMGASGS